jgi:hypothetical protein
MDFRSLKHCTSQRGMARSRLTFWHEPAMRIRDRFIDCCVRWLHGLANWVSSSLPALSLLEFVECLYPALASVPPRAPVRSFEHQRYTWSKDSL